MMNCVVWEIGASGGLGVGDGGYYFRVIRYEGALYLIYVITEWIESSN